MKFYYYAATQKWMKTQLSKNIQLTDTSHQSIASISDQTLKKRDRLQEFNGTTDACSESLQVTKC